MLKVCIVGICGSMGRHIYELLQNNDEYQVICGIDQKSFEHVKTYISYDELNNNEIDLLIDFSKADFSYQTIKKALKDQIKVISGTTNLKKSEIDELIMIAKKNRVGFIHTPNFAKGASLMYKLINDYKDYFSSHDLIEIHKKRKIDKPSGTAKEYAINLDKNIENIQVLRLDNTNTTHQVIFSNQDERFTITHEILNQEAFDKGFMLSLKALGKDDIVGLKMFYEFYFDSTLP